MTSSNQAVLCRYSYDPLDRLASSSPVGQADLQRFYQQNRLATEIQGALRRTVFQHEDLLLAQQRRVDGALETTLLATDQQRSVLQLVDKAGTEPIAYSPYGHHPAESGLTSLLGFNGERRDPVTGHYLLGNGYRAYNPVLMRFNSPDSLSPFGEGGLNAYGYVGGDPVGFGDPTGHISFKQIFDLLHSDAYLRRVSMDKARAKNPILSSMLDNEVAHDPKRVDLNLDDSSIVTPVATSSAGSSKGSVNELSSQSEGLLSRRDFKRYRSVLDSKLNISGAKTIKAMNTMDRHIKKRVDAVAKIKKHFEVRIRIGLGNSNNKTSLVRYTKMESDIDHDYALFKKNMSRVRTGEPAGLSRD
ncbi:hypothetical protein ALQ08_03035 [Pseudomonas syringae pv. delphinii]|uniref:Teneurin-like YD-shell domain-containing protein n=1 Tax=Pseudomonas syringae pv. delphinii TaxID=192088 RepID=A0A0P9R089_9PSED|nr:RHS repeat-associated core domain-containing protein [Pseudomonas syringae group genomosp. 3]KPX21355.1 Uncharacterized protein ALO72_01370 [Pseudomonas syringae pv. delphinii]RMP21226.1 hypothetical protein ALQ27_00216 [Pseudomonas syringae pv. delphinii]RMQ21773.1 hypothetical protein ALQ08_03035 [Pseudomonas syringae pv. delphinii]